MTKLLLILLAVSSFLLSGTSNKFTESEEIFSRIRGRSLLQANAPTQGPANSPIQGPANSPTQGPANSPTQGPANSPSQGPANSPTSAPGGPPPAPSPQSTQASTPAVAPAPATLASPTASPTAPPVAATPAVAPAAAPGVAPAPAPGPTAQEVFSVCSNAGSSSKAFGLCFPGVPTFQYAHLQRSFRYASSAYQSFPGGDYSWTISTSINWGDYFRGWAVKDQGSCAACWAFSAVGAIEAASSIFQAKLAPPRYSEQHIIDCEGQSTCTGGWPGDALEFAATNDLYFEANYPYIGRPSTLPSCNVSSNTGVTISEFEEVNFGGWLGLLLAVQQQPVIVSIQASADSFLTYDGSGIFADETCYSTGVDHNVLLVGYNILSQPPYWVIRNSWGPNWGSHGYMKLKIEGGPGVCGINVLPGYVPILKQGSDTCNTNNFGNTYIRKNDLGGTGTIQPCGQYQCSPFGSSNRCACMPPFIETLNLDGSHTCIPDNPCTFFPTNPCGVGTCVGSGGNYSCACPVGYELGQLSFVGTPTCSPVDSVPLAAFQYIVPAAMECGLVSQNFGVVPSDLLSLNNGLNCDNEIPAGTALLIKTSFSGCSVTYVLNQMDTCMSLQKKFGIPKLSGSGSPNPFLDCYNLLSGQQVCLSLGTPSLPACTLPYTPNLAAGETCDTIVQSKFNGDYLAFFALNPGLYCDRMVSLAGGINLNAPTAQVCLAATSFGTIQQGCYQGKVATIAAGESCQHIAIKYFNGDVSAFRRANGCHVCVDQQLRTGAKFCSLANPRLCCKGGRSVKC